MKLSHWASVAEILGAGAIIVSLIYVALQIDQNTVAIEVSSNQGRLAYGREQSELLLTNPDLVDLIFKGEKSVESLTDKEKFLFYEYTTWRIAAWEMTYVENLDGIIDEQLWKAWDGYFHLLIDGKPGYQTFFNDTRPQWDSRFMRHIDAIYEKNETTESANE